MATGFTYRHYILKDHLGSWTTITDASGNVEEEHSYDAWGNFRDPYTWVGHSYDKPMFDRGYTGHEHLYAFGLINMNGRMYDPTMSSFLSVDAYVQSPDNSQAFNRYAYCWYNPLRYVDPTGWYMDNPKTDRALPPPDGDGIVDDGGNYSGNSSSGLVVYQDTFTRYDDGRCSIGYSYNGVGGVYCWDNWKRLFSDVPSTHGQGTTYSDPSYYYPTVSHNSNGSGGAGGGGGCGNRGGGNVLISSVQSQYNVGTGCNGAYYILNKGIELNGKKWIMPKCLSRAEKEKMQKYAYDVQKMQKSKGITPQHVKDIKAARGNQIIKAGRVGGAVVGVGVEMVDMNINRELNWSNVAGVAVSAATFIPIVGPYIGIGYLIFDVGYLVFTGSSFGEQLNSWAGGPIIKW